MFSMLYYRTRVFLLAQVILFQIGKEQRPFYQLHRSKDYIRLNFLSEPNQYPQIDKTIGFKSLVFCHCYKHWQSVSFFAAIWHIYVKDHVSDTKVPVAVVVASRISSRETLNLK